MVWGSDRGPNMNVYEILSVVNGCKRVGIKLANEQSLRKRAFNEKIGAGGNALLAAMIHGLEVVPINDYMMEELGKTYRKKRTDCLEFTEYDT